MFRGVLPAVIIAFLAFSPSAFAEEGTFTGASGHKTSGSVEVTKENGSIVIKLGESFSLDSAPDAYVALGNASKPTEGGLLGKLDSWTGEQSYSTPTTAALEDATEVIIWCKKYAVPLGVAKIR